MSCKSPDKTALDLKPSLILYLQVTQPMSNMFFILCFLLKHKKHVISKFVFLQLWYLSLSL